MMILFVDRPSIIDEVCLLLRPSIDGSWYV